MSTDWSKINIERIRQSNPPFSPLSSIITNIAKMRGKYYILIKYSILNILWADTVFDKTTPYSIIVVCRGLLSRERNRTLTINSSFRHSSINRIMRSNFEYVPTYWNFEKFRSALFALHAASIATIHSWKTSC